MTIEALLVFLLAILIVDVIIARYARGQR